MRDAIHIFKSNLLIVDDEKPHILLLEQMLRGAGYLSVTSTMESNEVCELHSRNHYDLILLDLQTSASMNGRALAQSAVTLDQNAVTQPAP
jgi:CheY-like chemotaxis protein